MGPNPFLTLGSLYETPETAPIRHQMRQWMQNTLDWVAAVLEQHPPSLPEPPVRRQALLILDEPLHVASAPIEPPVADFLNRRIAQAVEEIESEIVTGGMTIWKLYNHGFVVKTAEVTVGFDLHQGPFESFRIEPELFERLLQATQVLFISHAHSDHADAYAVPRMVALGRPVVVPPRMWEDAPFYPALIKPERHWEVAQRLILDGAALAYRVFPGHQGSALLNNVYLVELPGPLCVLHTGDQSNAEDFDVWIDRLHERFDVDVLLPNCWSTDLPRLIRGTSPCLVMTGHENELSHTVDHREAFSKTYGHITEVPTPVVVTAWGERYHYGSPGRGG